MKIYNSKPLVSLALSTFNAKKNVERAVNSMLAQTYDNVEILVVDDCSTDGTYELIVGLAKSNKKIRHQRNQNNLGIASTRNVLLDLAKGDYIAFFDDDDVSDPDRIVLQLKRLVTYQNQYKVNDVISHAARMQKFPNGEILRIATMGERTDIKAPSGLAVAERILLGKPLKDAYGSCATCSQMAPVELLKKIGGFDSQFLRSSDTDIVIRLSLIGTHFVGLAEPLVIQTMTKRADKTIDEEFDFQRKILEKYEGILQQNGLSLNFAKRWLEIKKHFIKRSYVVFFKSFCKLCFHNPSFVFKRSKFALKNLTSLITLSRFYERKKPT